ncbi:MAG: nickel pincer cofactor biosynthesis protein LarC [archaeon]
MKILYFDCKSGISGDMVVGALLDLGVDRKYLISELRKLKLRNYKVNIKKVRKKGIIATKFNVIYKEEARHRYLKDIYEIIDNSTLDVAVKQLSKDIFLELGKAEAKVHKINLDKVHFHEVGAIDSIIDIVSASILVKKINPEKIFTSRISVGSGKVKISHGIVSLPVPASKEILKNVPLKILKINSELVTPTGAAIIKTITNEFVDSFKIEKYRKGNGAGSKDLEIPNVLSVVLGEIDNSRKDKIIIETNIDDMNPELYGYVIEKLISKGAIDAFIQPSIMKKNRIGTMLTVICSEKTKEKLIDIVFSETTTFGIRVNNLQRVELERFFKKIKTKYGIVRIKIGKKSGKVVSIKPEYEYCKKLAIRNKVPIKEIYKEVEKGL